MAYLFRILTKDIVIAVAIDLRTRAAPDKKAQSLATIFFLRPYRISLLSIALSLARLVYNPIRSAVQNTNIMRI